MLLSRFFRLSLSAQNQFILFVERLQFLFHENTSISRIVYETRIYYPLLCGGIFSCYWIARKSVLALTLALRRYKDSSLIYFPARDCLIRKAVHRIAD